MADKSMGSGQVESDPEKRIIHFGSPPGAEYDRPKRKEAPDRLPPPTMEPIPEPAGSGLTHWWKKRGRG